ncbi:hypothetical protein BH23ACI1_BH23ACI1_20960 [soil metagenome]
MTEWRPPMGPGVLACAVVLLVYLGVAASVDFARVAGGFKGDEATYYSMAHSLARDGDLIFQRQDLLRVWEEFPGPEGIFLKRGARIDGVSLQGSWPFVVLEKSPDPSRSRLFYGKAFIYPLAAAPFVWLFGTNGFLVLHAFLLALNVGAGYLFLRARGSQPGLAAGFSLVFIFASVVPLYFVWLMPELFNVTLVFLAYFLWAYKLTGPGAPVGRLDALLRRPATDYAAAALLGIATFSKPTHILLMFPILAHLLWRRDVWRVLATGLVFTALVLGLFGGNLLITGEANYQGGEFGRKSFYGRTGFPFANPWETFDNRGQVLTTDEVPTDILFHRDTVTVFGWNVMYFVIGRYSGLLPYFFPGIVASALFLVGRRARLGWQWLVFGGLAGGAIAFLLYMPYTYSGGGGPIGNRYFISFYPLFLFLMPAVRGARVPLLALGVGALFTARLLFTPFQASFNPGDHARSGPLRLLPIELTMVNDLPVGADPDRARRSLGGAPPIRAYFTDQNAYPPEGDAFWVRGASRADLILRAPTAEGTGGEVIPLRVRSLAVEITNGMVPNRVTISSGFRRQQIDLAAGEVATVDIAPAPGVPYRPSIYPTNFVYPLTISTSAGFAPFLEDPGGSDDSRYLGVRVHVVPTYRNLPPPSAGGSSTQDR